MTATIASRLNGSRTDCRITRLRPEPLTAEQGLALVEAARDFQKRGNPNGADTWDFIDILTVLARTAETENDAGWLVLIGEKLVGFQILCFGNSLHQGDVEGQIVAFYLRPGTPLDVAPRMVEAMKQHAREVGARRIIAATQRDVLGAFRRLGAHPVGVVYELSIHENQEVSAPCPGSFLS